MCANRSEAMALIDQSALENLEVAGLITTARSKMAPVLSNGAPLLFTLGSPQHPLACPFHPAPFGNEEKARVSIILQLGAAEAAFIEALETAALTRLTEAPENFGKGLTPEAIRLMWKSTIRDWQGQKSVKLKITMPPSANSARCWDLEGNSIATPNLANTRVGAKVVAKHIWFTAAGIGMLLEVTDLLVCPTEAPSSPWA